MPSLISKSMEDIIEFENEDTDSPDAGTTKTQRHEVTPSLLCASSCFSVFGVNQWHLK